MSDENRRAEFIQGLRDMADFFEENPTAAWPRTTYLNAWVNTKDEIVEHAKMSTWKKSYGGTWFALCKKFGPDLSLEVNVNREQVCERVVKGKTLMPAQPARPAYEVEEVDWICSEPLLSGD